jgi:hypothetical protein
MDTFDVISLLSYLLIPFGAIWLAKSTRSSGRKPSKAATAGIVTLAIVVPLLSGALLARILAGSELRSSIPHWVRDDGGFTTLAGSGDGWSSSTYLTNALMNNGWQPESACWIVALGSNTFGILAAFLLIGLLLRSICRKDAVP